MSKQVELRDFGRRGSRELFKFFENEMKSTLSDVNPINIF